MLALGGRKHKSRAGISAASPAGEAVVLPRPLRRVTRFALGLCSGRIGIPQYVGRLSFVGYCSFVGIYGVVAGGHGAQVAQSLTSFAGFAIEDVKVAGNEQTSEIDILQLLGLDGTTSLISLDIDAARDQLSRLPWVESAEVRKVYPSTIQVALRERKAYGIWQHGTELSLIERNGSVIGPLRDNKFATLPLFVGRDAETAAASVEQEFAKWPQIAGRVKAFIRVASRRWDIHLDNGVVVKLPEESLDDALALLSKLDAEQQVLARDIAAIDLRLPDRTTIQLTPEAQARRQVVLEQRAKALKKAEQSI